MATTIVFDLGGVLYDFQGDRLLTRHSRREVTREEIGDTWVPLVRDFETGVGDPLGFATRVIATFDLRLDEATFLEEFRLAAIGFYPGALDLVRAVAARHRVASLSNISAIQWARIAEGLAPVDPFHHHFPSHVIGFHKPDRGSYDAIERQLGRGDYLFLDDRAENVAGARAAGWQAHQVRGIGEATAILVAAGIIDPPTASVA